MSTVLSACVYWQMLQTFQVEMGALRPGETIDFKRVLVFMWI